jgi:hypothetical protein
MAGIGPSSEAAGGEADLLGVDEFVSFQGDGGSGSVGEGESPVGRQVDVGVSKGPAQAANEERFLLPLENVNELFPLEENDASGCRGEEFFAGFGFLIGVLGHLYLRGWSFVAKGIIHEGRSGGNIPV